MTRWISWVALASALTCGSVQAEGRIDRHALVTRHNVTLTEPDPLTPLTVGNGEFGFTADITGLQTFPEFHAQGTPLCTQSHWGWHTMPNPEGYTLADAMTDYDVAGRKVPYADGADSGGYSTAATWLRANPHRLHLGRIGLRLTKLDGSPADITDLTDTSQALDLWSGLLRSEFAIEGEPVKVQTVCHPTRDVLAVRIESPLLQSKRLAVLLAFPYGKADWRDAADWDRPERHTTRHEAIDNGAALTRILDEDRYNVRVKWSQGGQIRNPSQHEYEIWRQDGQSLEVVFAFSERPSEVQVPDFDAVRTAAARHWERFWNTGAAIDFSACTDRRAVELERRVVLSQYLMAIQCSGSRPPQETGLVYNSWFGKFHLEMHWWHGVHFALWDRLPLLERSLGWYESILPQARATAQMQGYTGVRWPKMTCPDGRESPSSVGVFLIWQQPHPIYYAELCYRSHSDRETLERYREIVFETAEFMASYPVWDESNSAFGPGGSLKSPGVPGDLGMAGPAETIPKPALRSGLRLPPDEIRATSDGDRSSGRYVLGPALIPAQESYGRYRATTLNPTFELAYWHWALETAQKWRLRFGLEREPRWDHVIEHLSQPTIRDGIYTAIETAPYTIRTDHPSMVAALGFVPQTPLIDPKVMERTLDSVMQDWDWPSTWGWDYPMLAMTAARLGAPEKAIDALFIDAQKNRYLANGHNYQSARLPVYLPGNGGLLTAVAMMAAGWDGCPDRPSPGFPGDGTWNVRWEGLRRMP